MEKWLKFGGAFVAMFMAACVAGPAFQYGWFSSQSTTILGSVIQALATASAIGASVWLATREADQRKAAELRGDAKEAFSQRRTVASMAETAAAHMRMLALGFRGNRNLANFQYAADLVDYHLASFREIRRDGFSATEMMALSAIVSGLLAARRDASELRDFLAMRPRGLSPDEGALLLEKVENLVIAFPLYADICEARAKDFGEFAESIRPTKSELGESAQWISVKKT